MHENLVRIKCPLTASLGNTKVNSSEHLYKSKKYWKCTCLEPPSRRRCFSIHVSLNRSLSGIPSCLGFRKPNSSIFSLYLNETVKLTWMAIKTLIKQQD